MQKILKIWVICLYIYGINLLAFPACMNYNLDMNNVPVTKTVEKNTRFNYADDLFIPLGISTAATALCPITAPMMIYFNYALLTNKINLSK